MGLARTDILIKKARSKSLTEDYSDTYGIPDSTFVEALQDGASHIQTFLTAEMIEPFTDYYSFNAVQGQEAYPVPPWAFLSGLIYNVEFSQDGQVSSLFDLDKASTYQRSSRDTGTVEQWYADADQIFVQPIPDSSTGLFRIRYERMLDLPDIRRGIITTHTISTGVLTALRIDTAQTFDSDALQNAEYLCVNDAWGRVTMRGIPILSFDPSSGDVTLDGSGYTFASGETITDGAYVTVGQSTTTHSKLPKLFEGWLIAWARNEIYLLQSSTDEDYTSPNLDKRLMKIAEVFSSLPAGRNQIPQTRGYW